ncbi:MAG: hypothetical protein ACFE9L_13330 [Candidatus Hodarchaeota archaeon]
MANELAKQEGLQQTIKYLKYNGPLFIRFRSENKSNLQKRL